MARGNTPSSRYAVRKSRTVQDNTADHGDLDAEEQLKISLLRQKDAARSPKAGLQKKVNFTEKENGKTNIAQQFWALL
eukprot:3648407-Amphidinium_carterae.1